MPAKKHTKLKLSFTSPVTLYICFTALAVFALDAAFVPGIIQKIFSAPASLKVAGGFDWKNALDYLRLFFHVLGHSGWRDMALNLSFVLILAPQLEKQYGSGVFALMILVCAFVSGILNVCFNQQPLCGSDGLVFMLALVASKNYVTKKELPFTAVLLLILLILKDFVNTDTQTKIRALIQIGGGLCGSLLVFLTAERGSSAKKTAKPAIETNLQD